MSDLLVIRKMEEEDFKAAAARECLIAWLDCSRIAALAELVPRLR